MINLKEYLNEQEEKKEEAKWFHKYSRSNLFLFMYNKKLCFFFFSSSFAPVSKFNDSEIFCLF